MEIKTPKIIQVEIEKILVLSMAHIQHNDMLLLRFNKHDLICYSAQNWYQIYLNKLETTNFSKFSKEFKIIYKYAIDHKEDFTWLKFDSDGPTLDIFPVFDW